MFDFRLSQSEIKAFRIVCGGNNVLSKIAEAIGISKSRSSEIMKRLEDKGFVSKSEQWPVKIFIDANAHATALKKIFLAEGSIPWEHYLSDLGCLVLLYLANEWDTATSVAQNIGVTSRSVHYVINRCHYNGMLEKEGTRYRLSERMPQLKLFITEFSSYYNTRLCMDIGQNTWKVWERGMDMLIASREPIDDERAQVTGVSDMQASTLIMRAQLYYISPTNEEPTFEDRLVHLLRWDPESDRVRRDIVQLLGRRENDFNVERLRQVSEKMGVKEKMEEILEDVL